MIRKFIYSLHRVLGAAVSLLFLMWFCTGLVLIYHPFPNVTAEQKNEKLEPLPDSLPSLDDLKFQIKNPDKTSKIRLRQFQGQTIVTVNEKKHSYTFCSDSNATVKKTDYKAIENIAKTWVNASVVKVDTLTDLEQWIMYSKYEKELPIYKFYFVDENGSQLYIGSKSGDVQQFTTSGQRFWAWVGAIPHTLYIPVLRKHTQLWIDTITVLAMIGLVMCIGGIYVGIDAYYRRYKSKGKFESPYRKKWYWWHHVVGLLFGIFLLTWAVSGVMSLKKVPQWITKTHEEYKIPMKIKGKHPSLDKYKLDYRLIKQKYPDLKEVEWSYYQGVPFYKTIIGQKELSFDALQDTLKELFLPQKAVEKSIRSIHGDSVKFTVTLINEYENYYLPWKKELALPVYKVEVDDADKSLYYINPKNGDYKYLNQNRKTRKWMFNALHYFHIKWLMDRPVLWTISIWVAALGCIVISGTGVWLSWKWLKRKLRKKKRS